MAEATTRWLLAAGLAALGTCAGACGGTDESGAEAPGIIADAGSEANGQGEAATEAADESADAREAPDGSEPPDSSADGADAAQADEDAQAEGGEAGEDGSGDGDAADEGPPAPVEPPGKWGKYAVGLVQLNPFDSARSRLVPLYIWYPASAPGSSKVTYMQLMAGDAYSDAPPAKSSGPFPVVLFSHGFKGIAFQSFSFTEYLASHGYVVVAPNHQGNTLFDFTSTDEDVAKVTLERPKDIVFALQHAAQLAKTTGNALEGMVDETRVAVTGHSFGGFTALIVAGAEADMDRAKQACAQGVQGDIFCPYVGYYPPGTVLRVAPKIAGLRALVALTPGGYNAIFDDNLAKVFVPGLVFGGTVDTTTPLDIEIRPI
jgi:hypothetical protein